MLRIEHRVPGKEGGRGQHGEDNRLFVEPALWIARVGSPRRDLSPASATGTAFSSASAVSSRLIAVYALSRTSD
jgi:hypothetical protein